MNKINLKNAVFTYYITNDITDCKELDLKFKFDEWKFFCSDKTEILNYICNNEAVVVLGYCIDSKNSILRIDIPKFILNVCRNQAWIELNRFAGKYVIIYVSKGKSYFFTDATATLPAFYTEVNNIVYVSSLEKLTSYYSNSGNDIDIIDMMKYADVSKTIPYNRTYHKNVFALLPNHMYSTAIKKEIRYSVETSHKTIHAEEAAQSTFNQLKNIALQMCSDYKIKCPITGGYDSRVVLGILKFLNIEFTAYTMKHNMNENDFDLSIPKAICEEFNIPYTVVKDAEIKKDFKIMCNDLFGNGMYSDYTLKLVCTLKEYLEGYCMINGDIIGQIGKASLHRSIPSFMMGYRYYNCKIHNTSNLSLVETKKWFDNIKKQVDKSKICDYFSVEIRLGRWAANENNFYSLFGINDLNIFNCNDIINVWKCVPRKERKKAYIHLNYLKLFNQNLCKYPYSNSENVINKIIKRNDLLFYIATFIKYYIQKNKIREN